MMRQHTRVIGWLLAVLAMAGFSALGLWQLQRMHAKQAMLDAQGPAVAQALPLSQALAEFERYGPTRLAVRDPAVAAMRLSGTFDPRHLDNFRKALPKVLPVRLLDPQGGEGAQTLIVAAP